MNRADSVVQPADETGHVGPVRQAIVEPMVAQPCRHDRLGGQELIDDRIGLDAPTKFAGQAMDRALEREGGDVGRVLKVGVRRAKPSPRVTRHDEVVLEERFERAGLAAQLPALRDLVLGDATCRKNVRPGCQVVFGVGNPRSRVVFVGEGPGRDEDLQCEPFVGRAGQLLTDIIEKGMRLSRADVYICNVVKCRPPQNRNPEPDEVATCSPFLFRQIELISPEVLVTLGKFAAHALLSTDVPITRLRGQWQDFRGIPVMPTFHPAYLLRNPAEKKTVWQDIKLVMARLGLPS